MNFNTVRKIFFIWMALTSLKASAEGMSPVCQKLVEMASSIKNVDDLAAPRTDFEHDVDHYALGGKKDMTARNQGPYGSCWAHASLSVYEYRARKNGVGVELSENFLIVQQLFKQSILALKQGYPLLAQTNFSPVTAGYSLDDALDLVNEVGLLPQSAWISRVDFTKNAQAANRFLLQLNTFITSIRNQLGDYATPADVADATDLIRKFIRSYVGPMPTEFEFNGTTYSSRSFRHSGIFAFNKNYYRGHTRAIDQEIEKVNTDLAGALTHNLSSSNLKVTDLMQKRDDLLEQRRTLYRSPPGANFFDINKENALKIFQIIKKHLDDTGEPIRLSIDWTDTFIDKKRGIISIHAFFPPQISADFLLEMARKTSDKEFGRHAVDIVDYEVDEKGQPIKLLVLNSHGQKVGEQGYYHVYWDYFERMAKGIITHVNFEE